MIKDHLILADAVDIKAEITEAGVVAAVVSILGHVLARFVATKNKKSITKTTRCCGVMCTRMGKSALVANQEIVQSTNAR